MNKTVSTYFIILCLLCTVFLMGLALNIQTVKASGTIYIRVDGCIDGPANITTVDYVTYYFNESNYDEIVVERDNIIIDGANYTLQGTGKGFNLANVNNVTIKNTNIKGYYYGIRLWYCSNNTIRSNNICNNGEAIYLDRSSNNTITGNTIVNNDYGIRLSSSNNIFCHNNLIDNTRQVNILSSGCANFWNNTIEGNYWSDYNGTDSDRDGIGDTHYQIDSDNTDNYPLMGMFSSFNTSLRKNVNVISNSNIDDFDYFESNSTIIMHVTNSSAAQTYGFCRICIPHPLVSTPFNVTIDGASPVFLNSAVYDNGTHRWIYFAYQHSTLEIIITPEFPSFLILPLFMIATLLAVIIYRREYSIC